jgi:maleate isomerase
MYGWRARIGLLAPATNATVENEFRRLAANLEGVTVHVDRVVGPPGPISKQWEIDFGKGCLDAAIRVASVEPKVIAIGNTSGTFINDEREMISEIEKVTKIPVVTTANAVVQSLKRLKIHNLGVATPYPPEFNEYLKKYLTGNGFNIVDFKSNHTTDILTIGRYEPSVAYALARTLHGSFEGIFISCTDFRTIDVLNALEDDMGVPVISSNQATFSESLLRIGIKSPIQGFGSLLTRNFLAQ